MIRVKICGLTRQQDVEQAIQLGAWALGFIQFKKSPRFIQASQIKEITLSIPKETPKVGVFVNPDFNEVQEAVSEAGFNWLQLHGQETDEFALELKKNIGLKIIRVVRVSDEDSLLSALSLRAADKILIDAPPTGDQWGGQGVCVDWHWANKLAKKLTSQPDQNSSESPHLILSGGLTPENIAQAYQAVRPWALDLSSGVESAPGVKSKQQLKNLFNRIENLEE